MKNYYIERDKKKNIISAFSRPQYKEQEFLPETDKKILAFIKDQKSKINEVNLNEQKIRTKIRLMAIESLQSENELPADYK